MRTARVFMVLIWGVGSSMACSGSDVPDSSFIVRDALVPIDVPRDGGVFGPVDGGDMPVDGGSLDGGVKSMVDLVVTEVLLVSTDSEWIELYNPGPDAVDLSALQIELSPSGISNFPIYAATDPDGTRQEPVNLAAGEYAVGVPNPREANDIPGIADFVFGSPDVGTDVISDDGVLLQVKDELGATVDEVNIQNTGSDPDRVADRAFPIVSGVSLQLDEGVLTSTDNDDGNNWCSDSFRGPTPGLPNRDCETFILNEVLYDYDSVDGGVDLGHEFVEIAGPAGASLEGMVIRLIQGGGGAGEIKGTYPLSSVRMSLDGLYVVADIEPGGGVGTLVPNDPEQIIDLDLENGPDGLQLVFIAADQTVTLSDAFGYGAVPTDLQDDMNDLSALEGNPVDSVNIARVSLNWARFPSGRDTGDNRADFIYDPSPTPGEPNDDSRFDISLVEPNNFLRGESLSVRVSGLDFTDDMTLSIGGVSAMGCNITALDEYTCTLAANSINNSGPVDVTLTQRSEAGGNSATVSIMAAELNNETDQGNEADYCVIESPAAPLMTMVGATTAPVFGQLYELGQTEAPGPAANVLAQLGYGPSDPGQFNAWRWVSATYEGQTGTGNNNDRFQAQLTVPEAGMYRIAYRFSLDEGRTWTFCDNDGAGSNPGLDFSPNALDPLTVSN